VAMSRILGIRLAQALAAAALVAATVAPMGAAGATATATGSSRDRYVALGDSVPYGYSPLLEDPWIVSRFVGYPELIARRTHLDTTNLACPGQTAQALISRTADDQGCFELREAFAEEGIDLLHADYDGTQLAAALAAVRSDKPPELFTVQAGGNELIGCFDKGPKRVQQCLDEDLPRVTTSLTRLIARLRDAGSRARIVLVGYYLVPGIEREIVRLNQAIDRAARDQHVPYVDVARPFDTYAQRHHGDLCTTGLLIVTPDGECDVHPTLTGQRLLATTILEVTAR
jgi:lysophospholipase L1-like esterase